jgi:hypothetical protein
MTRQSLTRVTIAHLLGQMIQIAMGDSVADRRDPARVFEFAQPSLMKLIERLLNQA